VGPTPRFSPTPIFADKALALGASCVKLDEMTRAFSAFAENGVLTEPIYVRRILDRSGRVLRDNAVYEDIALPKESTWAHFFSDSLTKKGAGDCATNAWLTSRLLEEVVSKGHSGSLRATKIPAAGKTGTSSATMDVWFVGYTSQWMTTTWLGGRPARNRQLGYKDAAYMLTVPMFASFVYATQANSNLSAIPWSKPDGVLAADNGGPLPGQPAPPLPRAVRMPARRRLDSPWCPCKKQAPFEQGERTWRKPRKQP